MADQTEVKLPESLEVVAWLDDGLSASNGTEGTSFRVVTSKTKQSMPNSAVAAYNDALVRLSDAESALKARDAEIERLRGDAERLDWLDGLNRALNKQHGTTYQWKLVLSPNVVRLMAGRHDKGYIGDIDLHDSDARGVPSCRAAIDQARAEGGEKTK